MEAITSSSDQSNENMLQFLAGQEWEKEAEQVDRELAFSSRKRARHRRIEKQDNSKIHEKKYLGLEENRNSHT